MYLTLPLISLFFSIASLIPGVQWSEPKGTGKGNITLIMIPQNNSCGNDSDMIVAVKSDYQIVSQDTQLLNLIVNENTNNKTNSSKSNTVLQKCSNLKEECAKKPEREILKHPNTAKYFESDNRLPSENATNNTVNIYPVLSRNYQNLMALNGTLTTMPYNTVNVFQLLNMSESNNNNQSPINVKVPNASLLNTTTRNYNNFNLTEQSNHSLTQDNVVKSKSDNISLSMISSDDNFLNEALNVLERLKQDPSYYNKFKSNQIPSTDEIKEQEDIFLTDSKTKFLKSDDSALACDEGEGLGREFGPINQENQDISNLEGNGNENIPTSTCLPFFMSFSSEQTTTQLTDLNNHKEISFENVPLRGTGGNASQELVIHDNTSDANLSFSSKCKAPNNALEGIPQVTKTPMESYSSISVGYGVQSNDSYQTLSVKNCKPTGLYSESTNVTPHTTATSRTEYGVGPAENFTSVAKGEPSYLAQTLAAAKNVAAASELRINDTSQNLAVTTSISVSGYDLSQNHTECVSPTKSSVIPAPPNLEQANNPPSAGMMKSPDIQVLNSPQPEISVTKTNQIDQSLLSRPAVSLDGNTSPNLPKQTEQEIKNTVYVSNALLQTVSPIIIVSPPSTVNAAAAFNGLSELHTECVTAPIVQQESGLPQAGVGAIPKKITLEPQVSCATVNKEECSTQSHVEGQEACFKDNDLTLPLVKSSIFLANNNEMPKGKDIPISLNASLDEFSLSDLQERDDRMHGKVAELYNRNPILFNVEREPKGTFLKPQLKYYKSEIIKSPNFYFDKLYNPDSNKIVKMNFGGKNVIIEQKPSYKSETNNRICNNTSDNHNKLTNYEVESIDNDSIKVQPEPLAVTTSQVIISSKSNVYSGNEQKYLDTTTSKLIDLQQPANEEEKVMLTILNTLDKTTIGMDYNDQTQGNVTLQVISTPPMPVYDGKVLNPQKSDDSKKRIGDTLGQQYTESTNSQLNNQINYTTKQPNLPQKLRPKHPGRICSKPHKTKTNKLKTVPDLSKTSSSHENVQEDNILSKEKLSIPADSLQKIVIEIVRITKKPENKQDNFAVQSSFDNGGGVQSIEYKMDNMPHEDMRNIKQNFVPFQAAWKPVQTINKQTDTQLSDVMQPNAVYSNEKNKDSLKAEIYEPDGFPEKYLQNQNNNRFFENQDTSKQEEIPTIIKEYNGHFKQTATNNEKSLGANILKVLMAEKPVVKSE